jgi:hypothetical protein
VAFGDFYVRFQRKNHFIIKRLQKPRRLGKFEMYANCQYIMSIKQTEIGTIHKQSLLYQVKKMLLKLVMNLYESPIAGKTDNSDKVTIYDFFLHQGKVSKLKLIKYVVICAST